MKQNSGKHRCSIRLKNYDYSQAGGYFVTICTQNNECVFGEVINEEMRLNKYGKIVKDEWLKTREIRSNVMLDEYIVMPNHLHGIILIIDDVFVGAIRRVAPTAHPAGTRGALLRWW